MTLKELQQIMAHTRKKHANRWQILVEGEWEGGWREDNKSCWEHGCIGVIMPPGVRRWQTHTDEEGTWGEWEEAAPSEYYIYPDAAPAKVKEYIREMNTDYKDYLAAGWQPL